MGGLPKKSVSWKDPLHRGGGLPNPTESTMWGMQLVREELGTAARHVRNRAMKEPWKGVPT